MYHSSIFEEIPAKLSGIYILRRSVLKPKRVPGGKASRTRNVERVAYVGSSTTCVRKRLQQYFVEQTATTMHANLRNPVLLLIGSITHVDVYTSKLLRTDVDVMAAEVVLTERHEPVYRVPREANNIRGAAQLLAQRRKFSDAVLNLAPSYTVELPNIDYLRFKVQELEALSQSHEQQLKAIREQLVSLQKGEA